MEIEGLEAWPVDISRPWSLKDNSGEVAFVDRISDTLSIWSALIVDVASAAPQR